MIEAGMSTITVRLPKERLVELEEVAARFQVSTEDLARIGIEEFLSQPDEVFQSVITYVLQKNAELYRRLS
ncbi:DNA-binding protein [Promineifilum sp.]|uniref:DNA-binding protein n=1 Tax=Promineifilum sp. TaxID=2664178 RepID=UPI0035B138F2